MNKLLEYKCFVIKRDYDELRFVNGELYKGQLINDLPDGKGKLTLKDNSFFEGVFNGKFFQRGKYVHFSGITSEGKFLKDRLSQGKIKINSYFVVEGIWKMKRSVWRIKKGVLKDNEGKVLFNFSSDQVEDLAYDSGLFKIYYNFRDLGFSIVFDHFVDYEKNSYSPLVLTAECNSYYQKEDQLIHCQIEKTFFQNHLIPHSKKILIKDEKTIETRYKLICGIKIVEREK